MKVNVKEFKSFLKKATHNYSINSISFKITNEFIESKMIKPSRDVINILKFKNNIFEDVKDEKIWNFYEPNITILPFLNLIDDDDANILERSERIIIKNNKQKSNIFFCAEEIPSIFGANEPKDSFTPIVNIDINDDFKESFLPIKKIANTFGKIYLTIKDKILYIETMDKSNKFSNGISIELCEVDYEDCSICIDFSNFNNLMNIIDEDEFYKMDIYYVPEKELGMVCCYNTDDEITENYYLMSKSE